MIIADELLEEKDSIKKCELIYYISKKEPILFNTAIMLKVEILRMFLDEMNYEDIDKSYMLTLALIYTAKKINSPQEKLRLKLNIQENIDYIKSLGFSDEFAKDASRYKEPDEGEEDKRSRYAKILDIIDQFGGMIVHREDRLAFPIPKALDILEKTNLKNSKNPYLKDFVAYIKETDISEGPNLGVISDLQKNFLNLKSYEVANATRYIYDARAKLKGEFEEYELSNDNKFEFMFEDVVTNTADTINTNTNTNTNNKENIENIENTRKIEELKKEE